MWLVLEYDRVLQAQAVNKLERANISAQGIDREEQLQQIEKTKVSLLLVGKGWQPATIKALREQGLVCPVVHVVSHVDDTAYQSAQELECVDAVSYPVPIDYLRRWSRNDANEEVAATTETEPMDAITEILSANNSLNRKRTYTGAQPKLDFREGEDISKTRGRVVAVHSARGGVGKSVMVATLARHMAERNFSVAVVDLDPKGNILSMHRGQAAVTTDEWARLPAQMDERMVKQSLVQIQGFYLLPSGKTRDGVDVNTLRRIVYHLSQYFDLVLIDTTPSLAGTYTALELAHKVVFVMTPEWVSFKRFMEEYQALEHQKTAPNITVLINRLKKRRHEHVRTMRLTEEAQIKSDIVTIPEDKTLYKELVNAQPLVGSRDVRDGIEHLVSSLRFDPVVDQVRSESRTKRGRRK